MKRIATRLALLTIASTLLACVAPRPPMSPPATASTTDSSTTPEIALMPDVKVVIAMPEAVSSGGPGIDATATWIGDQTIGNGGTTGTINKPFCCYELDGSIRADRWDAIQGWTAEDATQARIEFEVEGESKVLKLHTSSDQLIWTYDGTEYTCDKDAPSDNLPPEFFDLMTSKGLRADLAGGGLNLIDTRFVKINFTNTLHPSCE